MIEEMKRKGKAESFWLLSEMKSKLGLKVDHFGEVEKLCSTHQNLGNHFKHMPNGDVAMRRFCLNLWITLLPSENEIVTLIKAEMAETATLLQEADSVIKTMQLEYA